jgi:hypothetical protein
MNKYILCSTSNILNNNYKDLKLWMTSIGKISLYPDLINIFDKNKKILKHKSEINEDLLKYLVTDNGKLVNNKILIYTTNINCHKFMTLTNDRLKLMEIEKRKELFCNKDNYNKFIKFIEDNNILNKCIINQDTNELNLNELNQNINQHQNELNQNTNIKQNELNQNELKQHRNINLNTNELNPNINPNELKQNTNELKQDINQNPNELNQNINELKQDINQNPNELNQNINQNTNELKQNINLNTNELNQHQTKIIIYSNSIKLKMKIKYKYYLSIIKNELINYSKNQESIFDNIYKIKLKCSNHSITYKIKYPSQIYIILNS